MLREEELNELLSKLDPDTRTLIAEVDLGVQAKEFCQSDVGQYIIGCCYQEIAVAHEKLAATAWWRRRRIQELQNQIWRARAMLVWLRDLIVAAKSANGALAEAEPDSN